MSAQPAEPFTYADALADAVEQIAEYAADMRAEETCARNAVDGGYWRRIGGHVVADEERPDREEWDE